MGRSVGSLVVVSTVLLSRRFWESWLYCLLARGDWKRRGYASYWKCGLPFCALALGFELLVWKRLVDLGGGKEDEVANAVVRCGKEYLAGGGVA